MISISFIEGQDYPEILPLISGTDQIQTLSGYTQALNHFTWRVAQLQETRAEVEAVETRKVEL